MMMHPTNQLYINMQHKLWQASNYVYNVPQSCESSNFVDFTAKSSISSIHKEWRWKCLWSRRERGWVGAFGGCEWLFHFILLQICFLTIYQIGLKLLKIVWFSTQFMTNIHFVLPPLSQFIYTLSYWSGATLKI